MLYIDMIAFYLQSAGGITVVWKELITRMLRDRWDITLILQDKECKNIYFSEIMNMNPCVIQEKGSYTRIKRYMPVQCKMQINDQFVSTYYRVINNPKLVQFCIVHDFTYEYYVKGIKKWIHTIQKRKSVDSADRIICVSNNTKKDLEKFFPEAIHKNITVIYNGVSDVYRPVSNRIKDELLEEIKEKTFFLYVGSRAAYKRFDFAVELAAKQNIFLIIVGGGKLTNKEIQMLQSKLQGNYMQLLGISDDKLNALYNQASALLYPSEYEGFGIPIIEAQKAGCPVLAYNGSSVSEIVGDTEQLLKSYDIDEAGQILNKIVTKDAIKIAALHAANYSWEKTYQKYREIFKQ